MTRSHSHSRSWSRSPPGRLHPSCHVSAYAFPFLLVIWLLLGADYVFIPVAWNTFTANFIIRECFVALRLVSFSLAGKAESGKAWNLGSWEAWQAVKPLCCWCVESRVDAAADAVGSRCLPGFVHFYAAYK